MQREPKFDLLTSAHALDQVQPLVSARFREDNCSRSDTSNGNEGRRPFIGAMEVKDSKWLCSQQ